MGLGESATLKEIKEAYREMVKRHHPDKCKYEEKERCEEQMKEINRAYHLLIKYCDGYKYSFTKKGVEDPYIRYMEGFQNDWMWGSGSPEKEKNRGEIENDHRRS